MSNVARALGEEQHYYVVTESAGVDESTQSQEASRALDHHRVDRVAS